MVVTQTMPSSLGEMITYNKQNKNVYGVRIPGDMSYDYLRREIMFGTIPVNTIVQIGYIDYYNIYAPLLYDCNNFFKVTGNDNDNDDDYDDFDDYEYELDNLSAASPLANMTISVNIGGNSSSQTITGGYSLVPMVVNSAPASQIIVNSSLESQLSFSFGGNLASQVSIGGNQAGQLNPIDNDIIQEMGGFKSLTVFHVAMLLNDDELLEFLFDNKENILKSTNDCGPIIFLAIVMKKLDYVKRILDSGFLLDYRAKVPELSLHSNNSALEVAVSFNDYKMIEFLISQGAEVNVTEPNALSSPIQIAARRDDVKMMKFLIEQGAVVNENVLKIASKSGMNLKAIKFLLNNPAVKLTSGGNDKSPSKPSLPGFSSFYTHKNSILFWPLIYGYKQMLACFLNAGADVNVVGKDGKMVYEAHASHKGCVEMVKEHLVKLIAADLEVCDRNRKNVKGEEYALFLVKCQKEVKVMKNIPVSGTDLTCYDLLRKEEDELTVCLKHFDNCIVLENNLIKIFPLYGRMLASRLKRCTIQST
ncbi:uncharacterized protein LOC123271853 [Cotesia glomerata]|uniref:uncharacterized protein LOC123271853 n=1 Tax=Cotesia glomerata TaxID=32391 RepID=UPI001D025CB2|nr:uncharacterized protein LOC123271853 [Cotesia glomerata]